MSDTSFTPYLEMSLHDLPELSFKSGLNDISNSVDAIGNLVELCIPENKMQLSDKMEAIVNKTAITMEAMRNTQEYYPYFKSLDKLSSKLGENVLAIFNVLKDEVQPQVESLKEAVLKLRQEKLEADNKTVILTNNPKINTDFTTLDWDLYINRVGGPQHIVDEFKRITGGYGANFDFSDIRGALRHLIVDEIKLDPKALADCQNRLHTVSNVVPAQEIDHLFEMILDPYTFSAALHSYTDKCLHTNLFADCINTIVPVLDHQHDLVARFKNIALNLPEEYIDKIHVNMDKLLDLQMVCAYEFMILRKHFGSAILIDKKTINKDLYPDFQSRKGDLDKLGKYLAVYMNASEVADTGVTIDQIEEVDDTLDENWTEMVASFTKNSNSILRQYNLLSLRDTLHTYLKSIPVDKLPEGMNNEQFYLLKKHLINAYCNALDANADNNLENVLYSFVIDTYYDGTMVGTAHRLFGTEMVNQIRNNNTLDDASYGLIDAKVAAAICATFIVNELCDVK